MPQQPSDWETISGPDSGSDEWETVELPFGQAPEPPQEEPGWFESLSEYVPQPVKSAWDWAVTAPEFVAKPVAEKAMELSEWINPERAADYSPRSLVSAYLESLGNVVPSLASPLNVATMGAFGGATTAAKYGLPTAAKGLTRVGQGLSAPVAAEGAYHVGTAESLPEALLGGIELAGGVLGTRAKVPQSKAAPIAEPLPVRPPGIIDLPLNRPAPIETPPIEVTMRSDPNYTGGIGDAELAGSVPYPRAAPGSPAAKLEAQQLKNVEPPPMFDLSQATPEGLAELNRFMDEGVPAMTPEMAAAGLTEPVRPPVSNREMFELSNQLEARPPQLFEQQVLGGPEFQPDIPVTQEPVLGGTSPIFDPSTIKGLQRTSEVQFIDPKTGQTRPASQAVPGDVPLIPETPTSPVAKAPKSGFTQWLDDLVKGESGELDVDKILKFENPIKKFLKDESGTFDIDRLRELYQKKVAGTLTPDELAEARKIASERRKPRSYSDFARAGKPEVSTGPLVPENVGLSSVTESLQQRLRKAVENPDPTKVPEEISDIIDEAAEVINKLPNGPAKQGLIRQALGVNKALLTSWDLSAPGRQGKAFLFNKEWWTSLDDMIRAWGSKVAADNINQSIIEHPSGYFRRGETETGRPTKSFADKVGLDLAASEEMFTGTVTRVAAKLPGLTRSSRAHTAFLNKLRSDTFVSMMNAAKEVGLNPENNLQIARAYAKFINDATGRGSVNIGNWKLERNMQMMNDVFFAPKNMAGQIRTWNNVLNPVRYWNYDPVLRKQALKSLFAVAGVGLTVGELAKLAGAKVSNDPTNTDFRKVKIGDTRIDPFGGYQQFPVAAMKLALGQSTSSISGKTTDLTAGKFGQLTRASVAERFFINRLSPIGSFVYSWLSSREFDGKPFEWKRAVFERVFPIAVKDIIELSQEDPALAVALAPSTIMGLTGTQHYTGR